jgi:glycosyltransferase involved in cell wall biosynthesis
MDGVKATIIVSFYNNFDKLKLVLAGFTMQTLKDFEIIVADDGSNSEVVENIRQIIPDYSFPIKHIWHEDIGWRKNIILNKAIAASNGEILIFIDGDCIPHPRFVEEHYVNREDNCALAGRRVNMSEIVTQKLTEKKIIEGYLQKLGLIKLFIDQLFRKTASHVENGLYFRNRFIRSWIKKENRGLVGCNFSLMKKDMLALNGFDERYNTAFLGEDTDVEVRLLHNGGRDKSMKHIAIVYHCFHPRMKYENVCFHIFNDNKAKKVTFTPYGIKK